MSIKVNLYSNLQSYTDGQRMVNVKGSTIDQCLGDLILQFPKLKPVLLTDNNALSPNILISINMTSANLQDLNQPVTGEDELFIVRVIGGG
jgi:molybdopterin converting factor small subunit